ncbi:hypothetical protein [Persicitalea jodogahamensis]|uniref:Uncharacterized protein n=1 Tax=Persicitalea jodogahamensis TaxID=402147 RepID=A0A8J3D4D5_9BACT|nr:hypothetical protein [Persicitalea jodogahamensis]GHB73218.1 hypothetical protein GCM10007390_29170 [Persicitalea jodogahamensis]
MDNKNKVDDTQDNSLAHALNEEKENKPKSYDPDRYLPTATSEQEYEPEKPLEEKEPDEGYSTNPAQGKEEASLHLADEDMDRRPENPLEEAENLKESYEKSQKNSAEEGK